MSGLVAPLSPTAPFPGSRLFALALGLLVFALGLQYLAGHADTRVNAVGGLLLQAAALGVLLTTFARILTPGTWLAVAGGGLLCLAASPVALRPGPEAVVGSALVILFALPLNFMASRKIGRAQSLLLLAGNVALAVLALMFTQAGQPAPGESFTTVLSGLLAWPFSGLLGALVFWAPAAVCLAQSLRPRTTPGPSPVLALLAAWLFLLTIVVAALAPHVSAAPAELLAAGLLVNAACLFTLGPPSSRRWLVLGALWLIAVGNALLNPATERIPPEAGPAADVPLALVAAGPSPFQSDGFPPELPGRDGLPAMGSWSATAPVTGVWTSAPLTASTSLVQIRISGTLHPPATSLVLRTADGREIAPLATSVTATGHWKRINFPVPDGTFQVVARSTGATTWLAFTAPVELSRVAWFAGKFVRSWVAWVGMALAGLIAGLAAFRLRSAATATAGPAVAWPLVPWLALLAYAVFFSQHLDPIAGPNDSGGYLNSAKALTEGHLGPAPRPVWGPAGGETDLMPYLATTFHPHASGRMAPEYPVGLPLIFAAGGSVLGLARGVPAMILLQLVLGVYFTRQLARALGLTGGWDWLAAFIIGLSPVYLHQGLQPQSDSPALVWCAAAVWWAWASRERPWLAVLAGLATALAVLVRPTNVLVIIPILIALAGSWRQLGLWILAGLPGAVWLAWYNHTLYGSALLTGYGDTSDGFGLRFVAPTLRAYAGWLPLLLTPLVVLAFAGPFLRGVALRARLMLAAWAGVFLVFYSCYWCTWDNWYNMRFVLPAAPAMVVLALFVTRALAERAGLALFRPSTYWRNFAPTWLLVLGLGAQLIADSSSHRVLYWMHHNSVNAAGPRWLAEHVPANAVIFAKHATNSLLYYTDLPFVRSDHPRAQSPEYLAALARTGRPVYALNYWWEGHGQEATSPGRGEGRPLLPGTWTKLATLAGDEVHIWQWSPAPFVSPAATSH